MNITPQSMPSSFSTVRLRTCLLPYEQYASEHAFFLINSTPQSMPSSLMQIICEHLRNLVAGDLQEEAVGEGPEADAERDTDARTRNSMGLCLRLVC